MGKDQKKFLPSWLSSQQVNFGLDLQGGSQLLLEIDFDSYLHDQVELLKNNLKNILKEANIGYQNVKSDNSKIYLALRNEKDKKRLESVINKFDSHLKIDNENSRYEIYYDSEAISSLRSKLIEQSIKIVRRRVDENGTKEPSIQLQGENNILLQVPGLENPAELKDMLGKTAKLSFHLVVSDANIEEAIKGKLPLGTMLLPIDNNKNDNKGDDLKYLVLQKRAVVTGDRLNNASVSFSDGDKSAVNRSVVNISFDPLGAKQFGNFTTSHVNQYLAIVLDGKIVSYANINEPITGGNCQISGNFTTDQAHQLSLLLRAGSLPAPLKVVEERTVGPNLGADSIEAGKKTFIVSFIMIGIFMMMFYGIMGLFANIALVANIIFIIAILSMFQASLTMPGIAGIILTIGMAVDANVLIFERIRDELKNGNSLLMSIDKGFSHAFTTIFDSNITTILVAIILYYFGSGAIRGFALTLIIGIASSMFSAITLTRLMMWAWFNKRKITVL